MKTRTLMQMLSALAVLGALAYWSMRPARDAGTGPRTGSTALDLGDLNEIARVEVISGTQEVVLARSTAGWTVASLWDYPADFPQLADLLRKLDELKVGDVIRGGTDHLDEFGLAATESEGTPQPARLKLYGSDAVLLADLVLGLPRAAAAGPTGFSLPDSQYLRVGDGPVLLAGPFLDAVPRRSLDWIDRNIIDVRAHDVQHLAVALRDGTGYGIRRADDGTYTGEGALADQVINVPGADLWTRSLQGLTASTIVDPASDRAALGLDEADVVTARTRDGLIITATLGSSLESGERHAVFHVAYEAPSAPAEGDEETARAAREKSEQEAARLQARVAPWIYLLQRSAAANLTMLREQLIAAAPEGSGPSAAP